MNQACIRVLLSASAIALAFALPTTVQAQEAGSQPATTATAPAPDAAEDADTVLEPIIVSARRVSENLQDVPVAVTAFSGEELHILNATRFSDVAAFTPGFTTWEASGNPTGFILSLRGQVQIDNIATLDPSVATYVDGFSWSRAYGANAGLLDIQSVQVLKGPQGTLFGRNTTGGALLIQTNDPRMDGFEAMASATYGRFDERVGTYMVNVPIADVVAVRGALQISNRDGYIRDLYTGAKYDDRDQIQGRLKMVIWPSDSFSILLSGEWYDYKSDGPARIGQFSRGLPAPGPTPPAFASAAQAFAAVFPIPGLTLNDYYRTVLGNENVVGLDYLPYTHTKTKTYTATFALDTDFGAVKLITGKRFVDSTSKFDVDGTPYPIHSAIGGQDLKQASAELQVTGKALHDRIDFALGGLYFTESGSDGSSSDAVPQFFPFSTVFYGDIDNKALGAYGQATWHATDKLSITGGLRYSNEDKGITLGNRSISLQNGAVICALTGATAPNCLRSRSDKFDSVSYMAGVDYRLSDDLMVYAKTSKGFRSGGQNMRAFSDLSFVPFKPEIVYEQEAGFKSELFDHRARLNVAAYYNRIDGAQRTTIRQITSGGVTQAYTLIENAAKVRNYGIEAELTAAVTSELRLSATGAIEKPKYLSFSESPTPTNPTGDRRSERFDEVSEEQFTLAADYTKPLGFGKLALHADYSWEGSVPLFDWNTPADPENAAIIDATTKSAGGVLGARAAITLNHPNIELALWGRNLNNNRAFVQGLFLDPFGYASGIRREPRTYGVTATWRFSGN